MANGTSMTAIRHQTRLALGVAPPGGLTDAQLLNRFLGSRDEAAFELLVWRHGPMVLRVCRRILRDAHAAEDAFQATFLTLARKACSIGRQEAVSSWLYKVAYRIALRARASAAKRSMRERPMVQQLAGARAGPADEAAWRELGPLLDDEVQRLPEKYRAAFVLCCLEGKTNEEAARELGCPKGTILSRLSRARERLRKRLDRRGLALSGVVFPYLADPQAWSLAAEPQALVESTVRLAVDLARDPSSTSGLPAAIARLLKSADRGWRRYWTLIVIALLMLTVTGVWAGAWAGGILSDPPRRNSGADSSSSGATNVVPPLEGGCHH